MTAKHHLSRILFVGMALSLFLAGCSSITVNYDYDTTTNFGQYRTYKWAPEPGNPTQVQDANQASQRSGLLSNRIKSAVDIELKAKGLTLSEGDADLMVIFHLGTQDKIQVTDWGYGYSSHYWGYGGRQVDVYQYQEGQMIIDLVEEQSHNLVWRGSGKGVVDSSPRSPEEMQARINDVVAQIMANYPPPLP